MFVTALHNIEKVEMEPVYGHKHQIDGYEFWSSVFIVYMADGKQQRFELFSRVGPEALKIK